MRTLLIICGWATVAWALCAPQNTASIGIDDHQNRLCVCSETETRNEALVVYDERYVTAGGNAAQKQRAAWELVSHFVHARALILRDVCGNAIDCGVGRDTSPIPITKENKTREDAKHLVKNIFIEMCQEIKMKDEL